MMVWNEAARAASLASRRGQAKEKDTGQHRVCIRCQRSKVDWEFRGTDEICMDCYRPREHVTTARSHQAQQHPYASKSAVQLLDSLTFYWGLKHGLV